LKSNNGDETRTCDGEDCGAGNPKLPSTQGHGNEQTFCGQGRQGGKETGSRATKSERGEDEKQE
jgi:hypothetical protein